MDEAKVGNNLLLVLETVEKEQCMRKLKIAYFIIAGVYAVMTIAIWSFGRIFLPILLPSCILLILGFFAKHIKSKFLHLCFIALGVVSLLLLLAALYAGLSFRFRYYSSPVNDGEYVHECTYG